MTQFKALYGSGIGSVSDLSSTVISDTRTRSWMTPPTELAIACNSARWRPNGGRPERSREESADPPAATSTCLLQLPGKSH